MPRFALGLNEYPIPEVRGEPRLFPDLRILVIVACAAFRSEADGAGLGNVVCL
jgi:hypothetical protein